MYIIKENTTKIDLKNKKQECYEHIKKQYFTSIKQAQNYLLEYEVYYTYIDYNKEKIRINKNETMLSSDFTSIDNKYRYITIYEIIKLEKFEGVK